MKRISLTLATTLAVGCAVVMPVAQQGAVLILSPRITAGSYQTQTSITPYTSASIDHLTLRIFQGSTELANKTIPKAALGNSITFTNLRNNTPYRIKAYAYLTDNTLISYDDASSWLDVTTGTDDRPSINPLPVHLVDIPFNGQGTGSLQVTSGSYAPAGPEKMGFVIQGIISSVVGLGTGTDGGPASEASLSLPRGIAFDSSGNLYIADRGNARIRKVDKATGNISSVVGNGATGFSGDGGPATAANLNTPEFIVFDANDNLFFSDSFNHRIRKVDKATGNISSVVGNGATAFSGDGGAATDTTLDTPTGLAFDSAGNLYISDNGHKRVRKVDLSTGITTTYVGGGTGSDGGPATAANIACFGITFDASGNLFLADYGNYRIRKIDKATGIISTVAGNGGTSSSGDGGPATAAGVFKATDVAIDILGNLYIAEWGNHRIRKVDTNGIITTLAGNGIPGSAGDGGSASAATLKNPYGMALDAQGNLYFSDQNNTRIRLIQ